MSPSSVESLSLTVHQPPARAADLFLAAYGNEPIRGELYSLDHLETLVEVRRRWIKPRPHRLGSVRIPKVRPDRSFPA